MTLWLDAHLSPSLVIWLGSALGVSCSPVRDLGLRDAADRDIFMAAREARAVIVTKDADFVQLLDHHGPPPQVVWLTCGNTSNERLREILSAAWPSVERLLDVGEPLIEIGADLADR